MELDEFGASFELTSQLTLCLQNFTFVHRSGAVCGPQWIYLLSHYKHRASSIALQRYHKNDSVSAMDHWKIQIFRLSLRITLVRLEKLRKIGGD